VLKLGLPACSDGGSVSLRTARESSLTGLTAMLVQVETYMGKLNSDKAFKQEYIKLWSEQRR
jgi:hypothetical protein